MMGIAQTLVSGMLSTRRILGIARNRYVHSSTQLRSGRIQAESLPGPNRQYEAGFACTKRTTPSTFLPFISPLRTT